MSTSKPRQPEHPQANVSASFALSPPNVIGLLPDIPDGQPHLLPTPATALPLRVEFQMWSNSFPEPGAPDTLTLYLSNKLVDSKSWEAPVQPEDLFINIPPKSLTDGEHELTYKVVLASSNEETSVPYIMTIDKIPPALPFKNSIEFPKEVGQTGVTEKYLKAHGDRLMGTFPPYQGAIPGDELVTYWSVAPGALDNEEVERRMLSKDELSADIVVTFSGAAIRAAGDGLRFASYRIFDRAQNAAQTSTAKNLMVEAQPVARLLKAPTLKEAIGGLTGSTLQPTAAAAGATLVVPADVEIEDDERVTVFWNTPGEPGAYSSSQPLQAGGREYRIPAANVALSSGHTFPLFYTLTGPEEELTSDPHTLRVLTVSNLPTPSCDKITGSYLSIGHVGSEGAAVSVPAQASDPAWPLIATTQHTKMSLWGVNADDGENLRIDFPPQPVKNATGTVDIGMITQADLRKFAINHDLDIEVFVTFDGQKTWQPFKVLKPLLVA
ncbi:hypothetical protein F3J44_28480 [Pantoea sp. Tr-811]|uniref:hypothetical protein n=1 Tax=Pantoea sp. Tr-811 TaxID=2608361 RepID=UPI001420B49A|nr:hypothetical protein [Pantoea sp. Tr-811]NIF30278.1 hypothetical protein [Pantoea sp. Tr-811]